MSGTKEGGLKAKYSNYQRHGRDFYREIGRKGGKNSTNGGFASLNVGSDGLTGYQRAKIAGRKGGLASRRGVGIHSGSASLRSLVDQCRGRKYASIKIKLDDDCIVNIAASELEKMATVCGAKTSFEQAFKSKLVVPS